MTIPELKKPITQEAINRYAQASGDLNPIHIDEAFAKRSAAGGTIAHGMLVLAYVSQMMTQAYGRSWLTGGRLDVRFRNPARPGDTLKVTGRVRQETPEAVVCEILCHNQRDEPIVTGDATVKLPK